MVNTKEERFYFYTVMISFVVISFSFVMFSTEPTITGYVIYPDYEELKPQIQELADNFPLIQHISDGSSICTEIVLSRDEAGNEVSYSYKIKKEDGKISVIDSRYSTYCDGFRDEDFIIKFVSYDRFDELRKNPTCDKFIKGGAGEYFYYLPSKFMNAGGLAECNEEFKDKYCPALYSCIDQTYMAAAKLRCCLPPTTTSKISSTVGTFLGSSSNEGIRLNPEQVQRAQDAAGQTVILKADTIGIFGSVYFWVFLAIVIGAFSIGYIAIRDEHKQKKINKKEEVTPKYQIRSNAEADYLLQLRGYIKNCIDNGYNYQMIYTELARLGWPKEVIDQEFANIARKWQ